MPPAKEMKPLTSWKSFPLTVGLAIAIGIGVATISSWTIRGETKIKEIADAAINIHQDKNVDRAHIDLADKYVKRQDLNAALHKIDKRLTGIEVKQQMILDRLPTR
jgi:2,3-bisphosphoglycerate-independent phosphoglycerate mutase